MRTIKDVSIEERVKEVGQQMPVDGDLRARLASD